MLAALVPTPAQRRRFPVRRQRAAADRRHRPAQEPVTANRGAAACAATENGGALPATPLPLTGGALFARTTFTGAEPLSQVATAVAPGSASSPSRSRCPRSPRPTSPRCPAAACSTVPGIGDVDLRPALAALIAPAGPAAVRQRRSAAEASASCQAGTPATWPAASRIGVALRARHQARHHRARSTATCTLDSQSIDPSNIDLAKVLAPRASTSPLLQATLQPILDTLPNVEVPALALRVRAAPGAADRTGDQLTRHALHVTSSSPARRCSTRSSARRPWTRTGVSCGSIAAAALGLGRSRLHDAQADADRRRPARATASSCRAPPTRAASPARRCTIRSLLGQAHGRAPEGRQERAVHRRRVKLPPAALRHTNRARYRAYIGNEKSLALKLERRMIVTGCARPARAR